MKTAVNLPVTAGFLWLPVGRTGSAVKLQFLSEGILFQEIDLILDPDHPQFYAALDVRRHAGKTVCVQGDVPESLLKGLHFLDHRPEPETVRRPQIHFTAETGWTNDPNGLVHCGGVWHLYYQWNPYGTEWGNMHWGHAVSRDLITWEHRETAMEPDEFGTVYSGCGWQDRENAAGFGRDALLFFYTAAGGSSRWSAEAGHRFTQRLAVSEDGGETLLKKGLILDYILGSNRDPKVFYHPESSAYIMVLFLDGHEFAVFRSRDLIRWELSQRFTAERMRECPDLFELQVMNEPGRRKWVFWSADGYYVVGNFDGYRFSPESEVLSAYDTPLPYAAQTFAGVRDRVVSIAWLRTENDRGQFRGMMSVPSELSLFRQGEEYRIRFQPAGEILKGAGKRMVYVPESGSIAVPLEGKPVMLKAVWEPGQRKEAEAGGRTIRVQAGDGEVLFLADHGIIEYWADGFTGLWKQRKTSCSVPLRSGPASAGWKCL